MMLNFKKKDNRYKTGAISNSQERSTSTIYNNSNAELADNSKIDELNNTRGPLLVVSHIRNGGNDDLKTEDGVSKEKTNPNRDVIIRNLINNCHNWTKYKNTYQAEDDVNSGPGIYLWTEINKTHGIHLSSKIAYVGLTRRNLGARSKEHYFKSAKQEFHTWLGQVEKKGNLLILFKSFPKKYLDEIEQYFIQKLKPTYNINHNNGGKRNGK